MAMYSLTRALCLVLSQATHTWLGARSLTGDESDIGATVGGRPAW
jgi:hypothetical protein